jgi:hypothetical protein
MKVYHVCGKSKFDRYIQMGKIKKPVRAWTNIISAEKFGCQTGRPIILRLKFPKTVIPLEGHKGNAVFIDKDFELPKEFMRSDKNE